MAVKIVVEEYRKLEDALQNTFANLETAIRIVLENGLRKDRTCITFRKKVLNGLN